jgi:type IV pilus assembly protein PilO
MKLTRSGTFNLLNVHIAAVAVLAIANLVLLVQLGLAWHTLRRDRPEELALKQTDLRMAELQAKPLRNLPERVADSTKGATHFYDGRVPGADSAILSELGALAAKANVRMSRGQYAFAPVLHDVTEVRMDETVSGEYADLMRFINSVERDKMFFVINGLTLTGQQGGLVNLRLKVTTYLHGAAAEHLPATTGGSDETVPDTGQNGGE